MQFALPPAFVFEILVENGDDVVHVQRELVVGRFLVIEHNARFDRRRRRLLRCQRGRRTGRFGMRRGRLQRGRRNGFLYLDGRSMLTGDRASLVHAPLC